MKCIHCDSESYAGVNYGRDIPTYLNNPDYDGAYNIYVVNGSRGDGFAGIGSDYCVVRDLNDHNLAHEFGHSLGLYHPHEHGDGCDDTPEISWEFDADGDGQRDCIGKHCYHTNIPPSSSNCPASNRAHPCDSIEFQDNNIMAYTFSGDQSDRAAFTPCQVGRMMNTLLTGFCDNVITVDPVYTPPSAHIGIEASVDFSEDCRYTFYFHASNNELRHRLSIQVRKPDGSYQTYHNEPWRDGGARERTFVIGDDPANRHGDYRLESNTTYLLVLTVENNHGSDFYSYEFTTADCDLGSTTGGSGEQEPDGEGDDSGQPPLTVVYPNPTTAAARLEYTIFEPCELEIFVVNGRYGRLISVMGQREFQNSGSYWVDIPAHLLERGDNHITLVVNGSPAASTKILKQ